MAWAWVVVSVVLVGGSVIQLGGTGWPHVERYRDLESRKGVAKSEKGDNSGALTHLVSAVLYDPIDTTQIINLGVGHMRLGTGMWASETMSQALLMDPRSPSAREYIHSLLPYPRPFKLEAVLRYWEGNAFLIGPSSLSEPGTQLGQASRAPESLVPLFASLRANPRNPQNLINFAVSLMGIHMDQPELLLFIYHCLTEANKIQPGVVEGENAAWLNRYEHQLRDQPKKLRKRVRKHFSEMNMPLMRVLMPKGPMVSLGWREYIDGRLLSNFGQYTEAAVYLKAAYRLSPEDAKLSVEVGVALALAGENIEAMEWFQRAYRLQPDLGFAKRMMIEGEERADAEEEEADLEEEELEKGEADPELARWLEEWGEVGRWRAVKSEGEVWRKTITQYMKRHKKMVEEEEDLSEKRFVVAVINGHIGIGNRLLTLGSAFLFALLTDRTLLIQWPNHMGRLDDLFQLPPEVEWRYDRVIELWDLNEVIAQTEYFEVFHDTPRLNALNELVCDDLNAAFTKPFVHYHGNQHLIALLQANPNNEARLEALGIGSAPFGPLMRYLLRPSPLLAVRLAKLQVQLFGSDGQCDVGIHTRGGMDAFDGEEVTFRKERGTGHDIKKDVVGCLRDHVSPQGGVNLKGAKVYLAADTVPGREAMQKSLENAYDSISVGSLESYPDRRSKEGLREAVMDMWMLGNCTHTIRSGKGGFSTFAIVAHDFGLHPDPQWVVLPCPEIRSPPACFAEKPEAARMGTWNTQLEAASLKCMGGMTKLVARLRKVGGLLPTCEELHQR